MTLAFALAMHVAVASPRPLPPPVINAVAPASEKGRSGYRRECVLAYIRELFSQKMNAVVDGWITFEGNQEVEIGRAVFTDELPGSVGGRLVFGISDIGSPQLLRPTRLPFATLERAVLSELHRFFRPELVGRFDEKIVFKPLSPDTQREIGRLVIDEELTRMRQKGFDLTVSEEAFEFLLRRGIHKTLGARPMKKTVQKFMGDAVREALKSGGHLSGTLTVSLHSAALAIVQ